MKYKAILLSLILLIILSSAITAQDDTDLSKARKQNNLKSIEQLRLNSSEETEPNQLQVVRQLMGRGAFISAADLLESLYVQSPDNVEVVNLLLRCYIELKATEKAEFLLQKRIEDTPYDFLNYSRLVDLYLKSGKDSLAYLYIEKTLKSFPGNESVYAAIITGMVRQNFFDIALEYIQKGRSDLKNNNLFALDAARVYETRREYDPAVREYFKALALDSTSAKNAERRMSMLIRYPDAPSEIIKTINSIVDTLPENQFALRFLQEAYVKNSQFEEAFAICLKLDSLTTNDGANLFGYMRVCHDRKMHDQVILIADYAKEQNYNTDIFGNFKSYYAEALTGVGRYHDAIATYEKIAETSPRHFDKGAAILAIGKVYRNNLNDVAQSLIYFDSVAAQFPNTNLLTQAWEEIGQLYISAGNLDSAKATYDKLLDKYRKTENKEATEYKLAMIQFYNRDYENANMSFRKLIAQYPRGYYVNDALINSLIISESQMSFPDALNDYAGVIFHEIREMPDSMALGYQSIIDRGESTLSGLAHVRLSEYWVNIGDTAKAFELLDAMEKFRLDYFYPYGLKLKGDILAANLLYDEAIETYQTILKEFDRYPFAGEVRTILQELTVPKPTS